MTPCAPACALVGVLAAARPAQAAGSATMDDLCREMAQLLDAEVATIYSLERGGDEALVVVGNVGFPHEVVGNLRLAVGDGIVGTVAACMHPIAIAGGARDPRFKSVRGIGEEDFPVLLAVPIARDSRCLGVLVFQRRVPEFAAREVRLARVLAATVALSLEAESGAAEAPDSRPATTLNLDGRPLSAGLGLGRVEIIPTAESLPAAGPPVTAAALARVEKDLARLRDRFPDPDGELVRALHRLDTLLSDTRFRERATGASPRELSALARDYARAPFQLAASAHGRAVDQSMLERARDVEELCVLLHLTAAGSRLRDAGRVWIGSRLGAVFALAATRNAAAVVLDGEATPEAVAIARAAGLPLLASVQGLFAWTRPGDLLVVDADRALVRVNPSASELALARRAAAGR